MEDTLISRRCLFTLLFIAFLCTCGRAQHTILQNETADRELRAVWMATVLNIDYPQNPTPSAATLQADFKSQLYRLRQAGMNAIFVQVRPAGDAIYPSSLAPWSEWLTGVQGKAPVSDFDPLAYMIKTAHAQGIELHAWVNPYRVAMTMDSLDKAPNHLLNTHPEWVRAYNGRRYLDPGLPEVRAHLGEVIDELISNYDLDGIHFDDYFYPYPAAGQPFPDRETFARYRRSQQLADWRRGNVNTFIAETHRRIKAKKPWIHFGISPYGVWRNQSQDPVRGSATRASVSSYDDLYGDALHWANNGTVDYLLPQLYWSMNYAPAGYKVLADWWAANTPASVALYTGHAAYKVGTDPADPDAWNTLEELPNQVAYNRNLPAVSGSVFFSSKSILLNPFGLAQRMADVYPAPALLPERIAPSPVTMRKVKVYKPKRTEKGMLLVWEVDKKLPKEEVPYYYAVYRSGGGTPTTLLHITPYGQGCHRLHYYDTTADAAVSYDYAVVPLDRYHRALSGNLQASVR
ncbi:family 10 glycosylhydrolase [Neolewinella aurantiaca]|uniref:Family 10 glycosylhydrolase n=1 Tax=Neolewinella aurantiaca TaxID=2602767 RepID=A0A5C7FHI8_9BACT|nr:family 10 glycosylhydrolase [Neolewinella aurantiaca]TXF89938.1 family 10 glycosylhydrolase [Neolewinella aurantiaca]